MRKTILILFLGLFLVAGIASLAMAQKAEKAMMGHHDQKCDMICKGLGLTDEQKAKIEDLRLAHQKKVLPLRTELQAKRNELKLAITAEKPDMKKIDSIIKEMGTIQVKIQKACITHKMEVRALLNDEQKKKFDMKLLGDRKKGGKHAKQGKCCPE